MESGGVDGFVASADSPAATGGATGGVALLVEGMCPYLVSADRRWASSVASADHRCLAVDPPAIVRPEKQRRLCLTAGHRECPAYRGAVELRAASEPPVGDDDLVGPRPLVQTLPILIGQHEPARIGLLDDRRSLRFLFVVALATLALGTLVYARLIVPGSPAEPTPSASPSVLAAAPSPSVEPSASPTVTPSPTPAPTASPSPTRGSPSPSAQRTYRVRAGDTLVSIAARFGTTAQKLKAINHITDPRTLHVGQVLTLP